MSLTRRGVLAFAGFGVSDLLSGCFGSPDGSDGTPSGNGGGGGTPKPTPKPTPTPTATPTPTPAENYPTLAERTADVWSELDWFATEYSDAINGYVVAVNQVRTRLDELDPSTGVTNEQVDRVEAASANLVDYVEEHLEPHFEVDPGLLRANNVYVQNIRRAVQRGDREAQRNEIDVARSFYQRVVSRPYIENELSRRPIYDALYSKLLAPKASNHVFGLLYPEQNFFSVAHPDLTDSTATDGVPQHDHEFPSGHVVYAHSHAHDETHVLTDHENDPKRRELYAYKDGGISILEDGALWRKGLKDFVPLHEDVFGPVRHPDRTNSAYVTVNTLTSDFTELPILLQRFDSASAAWDAREELVKAPGGTDGTETLAGRPWDRFFYQLGDVTMYAYLLAVGEFVVIAMPNPDQWGRRTAEFDRLGRTWLGVPEASS